MANLHFPPLSGHKDRIKGEEYPRLDPDDPRAITIVLSYWGLAGEDFKFWALPIDYATPGEQDLEAMRKKFEQAGMNCV
ncbi:hypothetical protein V5O48_003743 [Marasmius crinis-equi]|uniref:Uncharacterized protein n=1 Tax=Marasmius crinis-equi TaxID=585013 RepID=A0ABR3FSR8_9AGAR